MAVTHDIIIEQKKTIRLTCYKAVKFANDPDPTKKDCPWEPYGYKGIQEACKNCRWFTVTDEKHAGRPMIIDTEIGKVPIQTVGARIAHAVAPAFDPPPPAGSVSPEDVREE